MQQSDSFDHPCYDLHDLLRRLHGEDLLSALTAICAYHSKQDSQSISLADLCDSLVTAGGIVETSQATGPWWESPAYASIQILDLLLTEVLAELVTADSDDFPPWLAQATFVVFKHYRHWTTKHDRSVVSFLSENPGPVKLARLFLLFGKMDGDIPATILIDAISYIYTNRMNLDGQYMRCIRL